ncbi:hypothetical protein ABIF38_006403 [Bradyrhizobium japonicum]|uniref:hypothetical protein n=1 Tax=Bradyrhizobium elkanii TaxID=29448 RepID=UPI000365FF34|nr:hypothetical protein [Bradyrhizobium elkanii]WAX24334.1 hypothetical protein [Bradyrhizobium phage ppBeUSDA76-1]MCP1731289.1 hypothetical protein [Bradyrhizobium elkanii]MCS3575418.1 hypothetical protein [Bradyrhizobium elkanii]MCS3591891.1 hypothetical protein [Bradyrhizobium elkanii]MCS3621336.1 hypothetical protein [Bradyrhizobium elkanii]
MTQLEIAAAFVVAFGLFMFGYALGWLHRGLPRGHQPRGNFIPPTLPMSGSAMPPAPRKR